METNSLTLHECRFEEEVNKSDFALESNSKNETYEIPEKRRKSFRRLKFAAECPKTKTELGTCQMICDGPVLIIENIFVCEKMRNFGIGRRLLRYSILNSRQKFPNRLVFVHQGPSDEGERFFRRFGFIEIAKNAPKNELKNFRLLPPVKENIQDILRSREFIHADLFTKYPRLSQALTERLIEIEKRKLIPFLVLVRHHTLMVRYFEGSPLISGLISCLLEIEAGHTGSNILRSLKKFYDVADSILNTGHYSEIEDKWRLYYAYVSACLALFHYKNGTFKDALRECDYGLLKGNDLEDDTLVRFANYLIHEKLPKLSIPPELEPKGVFFCPKPLPNSIKISTGKLPSLENFFNEFYSKLKPLVIQDLVNQWPAFSKWSFEYLVELCGHRIVPVEIGSKYTDEDWRQTLMPFYEYVKTYVYKSRLENDLNATTDSGYLAQHRLLDQIPELCDDIILPDYCAFGTDSQNENHTTFNVFIGPSGSVSPLHTDPRHNFFCQIRGRKFVRLIHPKYREKLYLFDDMLRKNSSQINVEDPDLTEFPLFSDVQCEDIIVEPGECLFIPQEYFHHVRALSESISLSIWFGGSSTSTA